MSSRIRRELALWSWLQRSVELSRTSFASVLTNFSTDLKVLILGAPVHVICPTPPSFPFYLDALTFISLTRAHPNLLHALSQQSSITYLRVAVEGTDLRMLQPLAPRLSTLSIEEGAGASDFVSGCTRLEALTAAGSQVVDVVERLLTSLVTLSIKFIEEEDVTPLLDLLHSKHVAVEGLKCLKVHVVDEDEERDRLNDMEAMEVVGDWDQWSEVDEVCYQKKIELIVTGEW